MGDEFHDNRLSIDGNEEAYKEKTRIAEVAAATLCRLNSIMKQMKDWRDDRVKLRSNICRLKLALRVVGRETGDILHADPLIKHQRAEIKRLEAANQALRKEIVDVKTVIDAGDVATDAWKPGDALLEFKQQFLVERERLNNEILYLRSRLKEAVEGHEHSSEVEHLKCKLKRFMMVDHTMEIIFSDIVNKVAETIANLSEELVNVREYLRRSRLRNDELHVEVDKLKAMLRQTCDTSGDYQKRIVELDNLSRRLKSELRLFKVHLEDNSWNNSLDYSDNLQNAERLANDLMIKLRNDHEALLAAGDPECLRYIKRITELRIILKQLHVDLARSTVYLSDRNLENLECNQFLKQISSLKKTLEEILAEIDILKKDRVVTHFKAVGNNGLEYLQKIEQLESIIENARVIMNALTSRKDGNSNKIEDIKKLEGFINTACHGIKQLEVIVASNDRSSLFGRIEQLEESIVHLRIEVTKKDELVEALKDKLSKMGLAMDQRAKEVQDTQKRVVLLLEENKTLKNKSKKTEEKMSEAQRELENSRKELEQLQQVKHEGSAIKKKLQSDKESLLKEMGRMRDAVQKRDEEIKVIAGEKDTMEKALNAKIMDLGRSLEAATKEKQKLLNKISVLEGSESKLLERMKNQADEVRREKSLNEDAKKGSEELEDTRAELEQLRAELEASRESVNNANREIIDLKARLDHLSSDKAKLEASIFHLESKKEILVYQLGVEKTTGEERLKELTKLMLEYNELVDERTNLRNEREQLRTELTDLKAEKELLEQSLGNVNAKYSKLEDEVNEYKSERAALRTEIRHLKASAEDLAGKLSNARAEGSEASDKIQRLSFENSRLRDDFDASAAKNGGLEDRVRVLLTEKNEFTTRINELDGENAGLKDQLNKVQTENEYASVELNKLRAECDKARVEAASLQARLDETGRGNRALQRANEELKLKVIEAHSEYRILENQLKIVEMTNLALKREKDTLCREYVSNLRSGVLKAEKDGTMMVHEAIFNEPSEQIVERVRAETDAKRGNGRLEKTKKNPKEELKRLTVENEALKFELLSLRSQSFQAKTELARAKEELLRQRVELTQTEGEQVIRPISNNLEIMNLRYKEISGYGEYSENVGALARIDQSGVCYGSTEQEPGMEIERLLEVMSKLKIENVALKMELNTLRCNFVVNFAEDEKRRNQLRDALEEIRALKAELAKLRDERDSLRVRLDTAGTKLNHLESERAALKDELRALRETNSDLRQKVNGLRYDYQKLKEKNVGFESCIRGAIKQIQKYTMGTGKQGSLDDELVVLLKKYISDEELLQSMNKQVTSLKRSCVANPLICKL